MKNYYLNLKKSVSNNKVDSAFFSLLVITLISYAVFVVCYVAFRAFEIVSDAIWGSEEGSLLGLMLLPNILVIWLLTPVGLVSLIGLTLRTRKLPFIVLCLFAVTSAMCLYFAWN